jgi:hypothetical protein
MLLEGNHVNQSVCSNNTEVAGRGLTYSLPLFSVGVFHGVAPSYSSGARRWYSTQLPTFCFSAAALSWPAIRLPAWLLMPSCRHAIAHADGAPSRRPCLAMTYHVYSATTASPCASLGNLPDPEISFIMFVPHISAQIPPTFSINISNMFRAPNHIPPHLTPINTRIQLLVHQPAHHHIVSPHQVQAVRLLGRGLVVALLADDALDCVR